MEWNGSVVAPEIVDWKHDIVAYENDEVSLKCLATGNPTPSYYWFKVRLSLTSPILSNSSSKQSQPRGIRRMEWP